LAEVLILLSDTNSFFLLNWREKLVALFRRPQGNLCGRGREVSDLAEARAQADSNGASSLPASRRSILWSDGLLLAFLAALAALPYLNTLRNLFVYDDATQVVNNPYLQNFHHLKEIFTTPVWSFVGGDYSPNYYRPLMSFGYLLCRQFFGPRPLAFHLVNLVLSLLVVLLLFLVTWRMFDDRRLAFVAAGLFAVHPMHSESVAWIAAVTDLELTLFYLLTFWFFLGLSQVRGRRLILGESSMAVSFALALLAKEPAVILAPLAAIYEHSCREDRKQTSVGIKLSRYGPLWLLLLVYLIVRTHFVGGLAARSQLPDMGPDAVFFSALALAGQYVWKLFWPAKLCVFYVFRMSTSPSDPRVVGGAVALMGLAFLIVFFWNRVRLVSFALLFFFLNLAPVLNAHWMAANVFTERYLYLPSVGFCWVLGWAGTTLWEAATRHSAWWRGLVIVSALAIAALCTLKIVRRNRDWHDNETLYKATLGLQPDAYIIHINLAAIYLDRDDFKNAERELREADRVAPDYPLILYNFGLLNLKLKRYDEALGYLIRSILKNPNEPQPHLYLAQAYEQTGQAEFAEKEYLTAIRLSPLSQRAHAGLGEFYFDQRRFPEAESQFQESLRAVKTLNGYWGLGLVYWREGKYSEAEHVFQEAEALAPSSARAHIMLGLLYSDTKRNREALRELQTGLKGEPNNPQALAALRELQSRDSSGGGSNAGPVR
jgi:tetratricopeptide (TPR) repeat protein